jgi:signal transduction histidine kinase
MSVDLDSARIADLERQIAELTQQNASATRELDAFAYAVSHDLRAPLRSLLGFSQALLESNASNDGDAAKTRHYLERIQQASRKLSELIDALLSLSRISRAELHCREFDFSQLCREAAAAVLAKNTTRSIEITIVPNQFAYGDQRLVRTAVDLLLDNACKFTALQSAPRIEIGRTAEGEFYIADNGAGFDPVYAEKLFKPFQRLHGEPEFAGIGIGLATVQRIIARHAGTIRIDAKLNGGVTAFFALPAASGNA